VDLGTKANTSPPQTLKEHEGVIDLRLLRKTRSQKLCERGGRRHEPQTSLNEIRELGTVPRNEVRIDPDLRRRRRRPDELLNAPNIRVGHQIASHIASGGARLSGG
jgi:hypothetical protein